MNNLSVEHLDGYNAGIKRAAAVACEQTSAEVDIDCKRNGSFLLHDDTTTSNFPEQCCQR